RLSTLSGARAARRRVELAGARRVCPRMGRGPELDRLERDTDRLLPAGWGHEGGPPAAAGRGSTGDGPEEAARPRPPARGPAGAVSGPADAEGRTVWRLSGVAGADGQLAMCYVYTEDSTDRDWAVRIWQSLRYG